MLRRFVALAILALVAASASAATYYVSPSGSDSYTLTQAQSQSTPIKTLSYVVALIQGGNITSGDTVAFQRGQTFYGTLKFTSSIQRISFTAYGDSSAALPVIAGAVAVPSNLWSVHSGSIYKANLTGLLPASTVFSLYFNGVRMHKARWPNAPAGSQEPVFSRFVNSSDAWPGGAWDDYTIDKPSGYFTGSTVKFRSSHYTYGMSEVTHTRNADGSAHFVLTQSYYGGTDPGFGYWIEGPLSELDYAGEWYFDEPTQMVYLWTPASDSPAAHTVEIVIHSSGLTLVGARNLEISNIRFTKFGGNAVDIRNAGGTESQNVTITGCQFDSTDGTGLYIENGRNFIIENNVFKTCEARGLHLAGTCAASRISHNTVSEIGFVRAICQSVNCAIGILLDFATTFDEVSYNHVYTIGYIGIRFDGKNHTIHHNNVHGVTKTLSDGGALYCWGSYSSGSRVTENIVHDAFPNSDTLPPNSGGISHCLYFDDYVNYMYAAKNVLYNCYSSSLYLHDTVAILAEQNVLYNSTQMQVFVFEQFGERSTRDNVVRNNIIISGDPDSDLIVEATIFPNVGTSLFGTYYGNYLCSIYDTLQYENFYNAAGSRQYGNIECNVPESVLFVVDQFLSGNLISPSPSNWTGASTIGGWAKYPPETNLTVTNGQNCPAGCALWTMPTNYADTQPVLMYTTSVISVSAGASYLIDIDMVSSANGSAVALLRDRTNYRNVATGVSVPLRTTRTSRLYGIATALESDANVRLDIETRVSQRQVWVRSVAVKQVTTRPQRLDSIFVNPESSSRSFFLPNGRKYLDPMGNVVTYSVTLQPFSAVVLFDQGFDPSLVGPPQGYSSPSGMPAPNSAGSGTPSMAPQKSVTNAADTRQWTPILVLVAVLVFVGLL
eukprot:TRINITY_DN1100_c0_g1_i4.p1 TRINITY_DN1100_c0_g1~~TRINITY_DN1100_c0_g1_i4.p1  ORF type:complete len:891 (-),score=131.06 TRINITY_DN1100_c0_g1_i4:445-3117(-)